MVSRAQGVYMSLAACSPLKPFGQDDVSVSQSLVAKFQNSGLDIDDRSLAEWTAAVQFIGKSITAGWRLSLTLNINLA